MACVTLVVCLFTGMEVDALSRARINNLSFFFSGVGCGEEKRKETEREREREKERGLVFCHHPFQSFCIPPSHLFLNFSVYLVTMSQATMGGAFWHTATEFSQYLKPFIRIAPEIVFGGL